MTPLTPAAVMTEQQLQEIEANWTEGTGCDVCMAPLADDQMEMVHALIAEVRRLQQANEDDTVLLGTVAGQRDAAMNAHADALGRIQDYILAADASAKERDAALAERDAAVVRFHDWSGTDVPALNIALTAARQDAHEQRQRAEQAAAALTEARRVLREVMRRSQWKHAAGCYWQHSGAVDEAEDCDCDVRHIKAALAAVLAQEEPR
jgi:hypothetical protein